MHKFNFYLDKLKNSQINGSGKLCNHSSENVNFPLATVFTISFNSIATIEKTILSVISQNLKDYEYIIVDGGSTDGTVEIIKNYAKYLSYWISECDAGPADAVNKAIALSRGKYLYWVNSDDWVEDSYLSVAINVLESNPDADYVYGNLNYYDEKGLFSFTQKGDLNYAKKIKYEMPRINPPSIVIKKNVFCKIGPVNTNLYVASDYELFLRLHVSGGYGVYSDQLYANHRLGGISSKHVFRGLGEIRKAAISNRSSFFISNYFYYKYMIRVLIKFFLKKILNEKSYLFITRIFIKQIK